MARVENPAGRGQTAGPMHVSITSLAAVLLSLSALLLTALPASPAFGQRASLPDIEDEVMCPICGTLLELSGSPQAERQRALIRRLIDQGQSKQQIKNTLVAEYGPDVLATPDASGFDLAAWIIPALAIALGVIGLGVGLRRMGRLRPSPAPTPPSTADAERLDADLRSYDG